jgi:hypothetical protein
VLANALFQDLAQIGLLLPDSPRRCRFRPLTTIRRQMLLGKVSKTATVCEQNAQLTHDPRAKIFRFTSVGADNIAVGLLISQLLTLQRSRCVFFLRSSVKLWCCANRPAPI